MTWDEFRAAVLAVMESRGHDYVFKATTVGPEEFTIVGHYVVPVEDGAPGYVTKHGQRYELI